MSEWKEYKVSEIINEISMGPFGSNIKRDCYVDAGVPYLNGSNLCSVKLNEDVFNFVTEEKAKSLGRCVAKRGDIIVTHRGTIGQISYIPFDSKYELYLTGNSQFRLTVNSDMVRPDFLVYFFHTRIGQYRLLSNASQVGVPALARPTSSFKELQVPVPPMEIQNEVMAILHSLDDKIAINRRICENLEAQAQALFKHWFIDFAPFKNGKFVESELGMIPEGWRVGRFSDIFDLGPGGTPKTSEKAYWEKGTIPFFSPKDVNGVYCFETEKHITENGLNNCSSKLYKKNTVFITCRGTVGKVAMTAVPMAMNQSNYAVLSNKGYSQYFAYLVTVSIVKKLKFKANGAVFDAITTKDFNEQIIIPNKNIVSRFDTIIQPIFEEIHKIGFENLRLSSLRDTLLPKLMSGEIKV